MSWASKRRTIYFSFFLSLFLLTASLFYYIFIYKAPTCTDGIQNQDEQDIDCGGVCPKICEFQALDPIILWSRVFKVKNGIYNVVALVENPNFKTEALNVPYSFKLYDKDNILIAERFGKAYIPPRAITAIFERTVVTQEREPGRSPLFEFVKDPEWVKTDYEQPNVVVLNKELTEKDGNTKLEANIKNETVKVVEKIKVTGILTDKDGNAVAVSQTIIEKMSKNAVENVVFTWPGLLKDQTSQVEVIILVEK